jgi:transposase-like protein
MENSSTFALTEVNATTVGALRQERNLGDAVINVDRVVAADDHVLEERSEGEEMNVAVVNKDKKGGKPATITRKRRKGSHKQVDLTLRNHILLDVEAGMPVAKAAKEYGVHYTSIYSWMNKGIKAHRKLKTDKKLSTTRLNTNGTLTTNTTTDTTANILPVDTNRNEIKLRVKEVILHVSGTFVPAKGQLRITRELLNYLNEVGAHLTK